MISEMMTGDQMSEVNVSEEGISGVYAKKDIIYSSTMGLCIVSDITKLSADKNLTPVPYYVLKSYYDKTHVAYIPVEKHEGTYFTERPSEGVYAEKAMDKFFKEYNLNWEDYK